MSRSMEPFRFRKIGVASLGCRDFMCVVLQPLPAFPLIFFSLRLLRLSGRGRVGLGQRHVDRPLQ